MVRRPYPTYRDQTYPPIEAVWRALRELRAVPPGYATSGSRKKLFSASLEQAEQLFMAAAGVGPASRPLLLFYGLSQAGRAIAACAPVPLERFRLNGHGIVAACMDQPDVGSVTVKDKGSAGAESFTQVAAMLGSRSLPEHTPIADVWSAILEVALWPLASQAHRHLTITRETRGAPAGVLQAVVSGMPGHLQDHPNHEDRERAVRDWLSSYPALDGYSFLRAGAIPDSGPESWDERQGTIGCRVTWRVEDRDAAAGEKFEQIAPWKGRSLTGDNRILHARWGGDDRQLHPLLVWWAVLYALSMLARYQPGQWTAQIDVNRSGDAVAIEYLLDSALAAVPELILAAVEEVTA
ncbi:YaaC family protein [Streptomyces sp. NPDC003442]